MIHTSLSPNTQGDDILLAVKFLVFPWKWITWRKQSKVRKLEKKMESYLGEGQKAIAFQRGRDALFTVLKSLEISEGDEVILQAFTCIVVPNAIIYTGAKPVYADIEQNGYNIDPESIRQRVTSKTKAIIIQHTFGIPADIKAIQKICEEHNIYLIEDCAHALTGKYKGQALGTFGDAAMWSFGRDKIVSGVWGGMATSKNIEIAKKMESLRNSFHQPSVFQVFQSLFHPFLFTLIKPFYAYKIGRVLLVLFQKIRLMPMVFFPLEKKAKKPVWMPQQMVNANAELILQQWKKIHIYHQHRQAVAKMYSRALGLLSTLLIPSYNQESAYLRFPLELKKRNELLKKAKQKGIFLGDWYRSVLAPPQKSYDIFHYQQGSCPRAEKAAQSVVNLPTHIQMSPKKVQAVIDLFL